MYLILPDEIDGLGELEKQTLRDAFREWSEQAPAG